MNVTLWYSRLHEKGEQGFCLSRCSWAPRNSLLATAVSSSPHTSGTRLLALVVQKTSMCDCGCGGWCTLFPLYRFVLEPCVAGVTAKTPTSRYDLSPWIPSDDQRKALSGTDMAFKAVIKDMQWDWAEFAQTWGFRCGLPSNLTLPDIADSKTDGWVGRTMDDNTNGCTSCEVWTVVPNAAAHRDMTFVVDVQQQSEWAMYATWVPAIGPCVQTTACANDRLEPSLQMAHVM